MTVARIRRKSDGIEIRISGHAGYAPGNDIVCAAISNTAYMLLNFLLAYHDEALESYQDDPGNFIMEIKQGEKDRELTAAVKMFCIGIGQVAANYPDFVRLEEEL